MSNELGSISKVEMDLVGSVAAAQVQQQQAVAPKPEVSKPAEPVKEVRREKAPEPKAAPVMTSDVTLKFIVDQDSNNITVLVLDRANQRVIRAIPPEELNQFRGGDLLSLFA